MDAIAENYDDEIEQVRAYHKGDMCAAIEALLKDRDFLIKEIEYANLTRSLGLSRGGKSPAFAQ